MVPPKRSLVNLVSELCARAANNRKYAPGLVLMFCSVHVKQHAALLDWERKW